MRERPKLGRPMFLFFSVWVPLLTKGATFENLYYKTNIQHQFFCDEKVHQKIFIKGQFCKIELFKESMVLAFQLKLAEAHDHTILKLGHDEDYEEDEHYELEFNEYDDEDEEGDDDDDDEDGYEDDSKTKFSKRHFGRQKAKKDADKSKNIENTSDISSTSDINTSSSIKTKVTGTLNASHDTSSGAKTRHEKFMPNITKGMSLSKINKHDITNTYTTNGVYTNNTYFNQGNTNSPTSDSNIARAPETNALDNTLKMIISHTSITTTPNTTTRDIRPSALNFNFAEEYYGQGDDGRDRDNYVINNYEDEDVSNFSHGLIRIAKLIVYSEPMGLYNDSDSWICWRGPSYVPHWNRLHFDSSRLRNEEALQTQKKFSFIYIMRKPGTYYCRWEAPWLKQTVNRVRNIKPIRTDRAPEQNYRDDSFLTLSLLSFSLIFHFFILLSFFKLHLP